jgi:hypothetical protein
MGRNNVACALACGGVVAAAAALGLGAQEDRLTALARLGAPGEHHRHLQALAGDWKVATRMWAEPSAPPVESRGKMHASPILGGRFIESRYEGDLLGLLVSGVGIDGYDNRSQKHVGMWIDSQGTALVVLEGSCSEGGKVVTMTADFLDPVDGVAKTMKTVTTVVEDGRVVSETFVRAASGGEFVRTVETVYTR